MAIWRIPHRTRRVSKIPVQLLQAEVVVYTLTVADGACVSVGDGLDLTQEHNLVSTEGASVSVSESVDLIQEHNLLVSDAGVVTSGDTVTVSESGTITLTQHSFRFRNDNGDEDEATWAAALNGNFNIAPDNVIRIRFLIDAQGDNESKQFRLEYKKTTDVDWLVAA